MVSANRTKSLVAPKKKTVDLEFTQGCRMTMLDHMSKKQRLFYRI